jgi:hypothetical protein
MIEWTPPPYPPPAPPEASWKDIGPPPWRTAIRARRILRASAMRRRLARRRAFLRILSALRFWR